MSAPRDVRNIQGGVFSHVTCEIPKGQAGRFLSSQIVNFREKGNGNVSKPERVSVELCGWQLIKQGE